LKPSYFHINPDTGASYSYNQDFYLPFIIRYAHAIHMANSDAFIFFEPIPNEAPPNFANCKFVNDEEATKREEKNRSEKNMVPGILGMDDLWIRENRLVYAPHWYDLKTIFNKSFTGFITHDVQGLSAVCASLDISKNFEVNSY
jgi:hypothetical protein